MLQLLQLPKMLPIVTRMAYRQVDVFILDGWVWQCRQGSTGVFLCGLGIYDGVLTSAGGIFCMLSWFMFDPAW